MSDQKLNYMQQLDEWSNATVIVPLTRAIQSGEEEIYHACAENVEKAIRDKVRESYKNGVKAGAGAVRKELRR